MAVSEAQKLQLLDKAIEITKASAGSGAPACCHAETLVAVLNETYAAMLAIAEKIRP